jgi:mRNA turnover protein 4
MAKALGTTAETSHLPGLSSLSSYLKGDVGLLCSPRPPTEILPYFHESLTKTDFARAGIPASYTFTLPAGVLHSQGGQISVDDDTPLQHSTEPMLRKWGLPTRLDKGRVVLDEDYVVCEEGKMLNSHQTAVLKFFGVAMAEFKIRVLAYWTGEDGEVKEIDEDEKGEMEE